MKNSMNKTIVREVKGTFGRWFAILAICGLGVGFFCGLKVCREAFVATGDEYLEQLNFFDFEVISTLGIDEENIKELKELDSVGTVEGSYSTDCLIVIEENNGLNASEDIQMGDKVAKIYSLMDDINRVELVEGRMPKSDGECVVDYDRFSSVQIGQTIRISDENDEDTLDKLKYDEYRIVGTVSSPMYLNYERGSTKLSDGTVYCYMYIPKDGWDMEVYSEAFVTMKDGASIFTDDYDAKAEKLENELTDKFDVVAQSRYDEVLCEANAELAKAEKKIEDARHDLSEGKAELRKNEKKISDSEKEIEDNEKKLSDGEQEIENAEKEIAEKEQKILDGEKELDEAEGKLDEQQKELDAKKSMLPESMYQSYIDEITNGRTEIALKRAELENGKRQIEEAKEEINQKKKEIEEGIREITDGKKKIADAKNKIKNAKADIEDGQKKIDDGEIELADARKEIDDIESPDTYVLGRDTNIGFVCFENDTAIVEGIAKVFPVFFFLVAALVVMTTMTRMIDEQRTQIGVLKALGYSRRKVMGKYVWYSASAALIGGISGFIIGSYLFPWVIWEAYGIMYGFSDIIFVFNWTTGVISILVALFCAVGTTVLSCWYDLKEVPAELIRPKAPAVGKRILLERIGFIWNRMKFLHKVSARNVFRYKKRFFMMVLGISGCTALLVTGLGISDSIKNVASAQYDDIYKIDYAVTLKDDASDEERNEFIDSNKDIIKDALFVYSISCDAIHNEKTKSINLIACDDDGNFSNFVDLHTVEGAVSKGEKTPLEFPGEGECIINTNIAENLGLDVGDDIRIRDSDMNELKATIIGLCENHMYNYIYISKETYEKNWGSFRENSAYIIGYSDDDADGYLDNTGETKINSNSYITDKAQGGATLLNDDCASAVSVSQDFRDRITNMMKALDYVVALVVACAGALAFIVLYNLTNINITERIREIATIKVLGFTLSETAQYVFRENIVMTAISSVLGIPIGKWLHYFVMSQIQVDLISFDIHITCLSYILSVAATFAFAVIVSIVMYFKIKKINMAESLKSIE